MSQPSKAYSALARLLHWAVFALIVVQVVGGLVLDELPKRSALRSLAFDAHETLGLVVLLLVVARLLRTLASPGPSPLGPPWQRRLAKAAHATLYALMVAVPLVGYAMVNAKGHDVAFFAWSGPDILGKDEALARVLEQAHDVLAWALVATIALHVAAALWHHCVLRDDTLRRMLPASRGARP